MTELDAFDDVSNPLDSVEEIMSANDWVFDRRDEDELTVQITGKMGEYSLCFIWHETESAMQFACELDVAFSPSHLDQAAKTMSAINASLWLGHFDICDEKFCPRFRHTSLFRGMTATSGADHIEDLVEIAVNECERFYPVFHLLAQPAVCDESSMALAMMDIGGAA